MPRFHNKLVLESYEFTLQDLMLKLPDEVDESRVTFSAESWGSGAAEVKVIHQVPFTPEEEAAADAEDESRRRASLESIERRERRQLKELQDKYGEPK